MDMVKEKNGEFGSKVKLSPDNSRVKMSPVLPILSGEINGLGHNRRRANKKSYQGNPKSCPR